MFLILLYFSLVKCYTSSYSHNIIAQGLPDLYWNSSNPIFLISNTDHIIDVNSRPNLGPHQYEKINIICPKYPQFTPEKSMEKHIIYNVDKEEYDSCTITNSKPRIIAYCTNPSSENIFTISFRSFSPMPNSLEYHPGKSYYFVSTSSGDNLHAKKGGYCLNNNMKIVFKVGDTRSDTPQARARQLQIKNREKMFQNSSILTINNPKIPKDDKVNYSDGDGYQSSIFNSISGNSASTFDVYQEIIVIMTCVNVIEF